LHHAKLLRAGQPEQSRLPSVVRGHLDVRQKLGRILDLVDEDRGFETLQEQPRIIRRQCREHGVVERNVSALTCDQMPQKGCFPDLSRSAQEDSRKLLGSGGPC
jgi:hypothetical protein